MDSSLYYTKLPSNIQNMKLGLNTNSLFKERHIGFLIELVLPVQPHTFL